MDAQYVVTLGREMFVTAALISAPAIAVGMAVGIIMAIFQAITSVQEQTLTMIPKMIAVGVTLAVLLPWMMKTMAVFCTAVFAAIADAAF